MNTGGHGKSAPPTQKEGRSLEPERTFGKNNVALPNSNRTKPAKSTPFELNGDGVAGEIHDRGNENEIKQPDEPRDLTLRGKVTLVIPISAGFRVILNRGFGDDRKKAYYEHYPGAIFGKGVAKASSKQAKYKNHELPEGINLTKCIVIGKCSRELSSVFYYIVKYKGVIYALSSSQVKGRGKVAVPLGLEVERREMNILLRKCQQDKIHPETKQPLSQYDLEAMPWLENELPRLPQVSTSLQGPGLNTIAELNEFTDAPAETSTSDTSNPQVEEPPRETEEELAGIRANIKLLSEQNRLLNYYCDGLVATQERLKSENKMLKDEIARLNKTAQSTWQTGEEDSDDPCSVF